MPLSSHDPIDIRAWAFERVTIGVSQLGETDAIFFIEAAQTLTDWVLGRGRPSNSLADFADASEQPSAINGGDVAS